MQQLACEHVKDYGNVPWRPCLFWVFLLCICVCIYVIQAEKTMAAVLCMCEYVFVFVCLFVFLFAFMWCKPKTMSAVLYVCVCVWLGIGWASRPLSNRTHCPSPPPSTSKTVVKIISSLEHTLRILTKQKISQCCFQKAYLHSLPVPKIFETMINIVVSTSLCS